ncbi:hypothetical protein RHS03_02590, partial [Rhizoctonia solani]
MGPMSLSGPFDVSLGQRTYPIVKHQFNADDSNVCDIDRPRYYLNLGLDLALDASAREQSSVALHMPFGEKCIKRGSLRLGLQHMCASKLERSVTTDTDRRSGELVSLVDRYPTVHDCVPHIVISIMSTRSSHQLQAVCFLRPNIPYRYPQPTNTEINYEALLDQFKQLQGHIVGRNQSIAKDNLYMESVHDRRIGQTLHDATDACMSSAPISSQGLRNAAIRYQNSRSQRDRSQILMEAIQNALLSKGITLVLFGAARLTITSLDPTGTRMINSMKYTGNHLVDTQGAVDDSNNMVVCPPEELGLSGILDVALGTLFGFSYL